MTAGTRSLLLDWRGWYDETFYDRKTFMYSLQQPHSLQILSLFESKVVPK